jgi:hypothetical protein
MNAHPTYTVPMALQDFVPVLISAIGLLLLARTAHALSTTLGRICTIGAVLAALGGLSKAVWKLIIASTGTDISVLDNALFWLLGPGFVLMAYGMSYVVRVLRGKPLRRAQPWAMPLLVIALFYAVAIALAGLRPEMRTWNLILLLMTTAGNFTLSGILIAHALRNGRRDIAALFALNLLLILVLSGFARSADSRTFAMQWTEQGLNTVATAAFAFGAWRFRRLVVAANTTTTIGAFARP